MERIVFGRWHVRCDRDGTRRAYEAAPKGSAEECGCSACRNCAAARTKVYPPAALDLLDRLGIDSRKEVEVYQIGRTEPGLQLYGWFFHLVGFIESGDDAIRPGGAVELEPVTEDFSMGFSARLPLVRPAFEGLPLVQLECLAQVPWVLRDEDEPD